MLKHTLFEKPKDDDEDFSDPRAKLIQERLRHYIKHYRSKRNRNRFFSRFFERVVIVVAGTLTVLLGLKNVWEYDVSRIAFVLSAAVTAATTWDGLCGPSLEMDQIPRCAPPAIRAPR